MIRRPAGADAERRTPGAERRKKRPGAPSARRPEAVVLKLGGSVITQKALGVPRVRSTTLRRLAREIAAARPRRLVLVHGAGSYGHPIVQATGIDRGVRDFRGRLAWAETQCWQNVLDVQIAASLGRAGVPAIPCQPSAMAVMRGGRIHRMDLAAVEGLLDTGMVPVLFGVPAYDRSRGCSILSGDQIAPFVASRLRFDLVVYVTDVDGVYDADPRVFPDAVRFPTIDGQTWPRVREALTPARKGDVTGGMRGKILELVGWARRGTRACVVDGNTPGRVRDALLGRPVGTVVEW